MKRAAIYVRISKDRHGDSLGVNRQEKACRALCEERDWQVVELYSDNDLSATTGKSRPGYERLVDDIKSGYVDAVAVYHSDRLYRRPSDLEELIGVVEDARIDIACVMQSDIDLTTASGRMTARVIGAVNRGEVERMSERIRAKHRELAESGAPPTGARAYGYEADRMTIRESEAEIVREMSSRLLAGESLSGLTRELNERGVPTAAGKSVWHASTLGSVMVGPRIAGIRRHKNEEFPGQWPGIVDRTTHERLKRRLISGKPRAASHKYLLSGGLIVCGLCGKPMHGKRRGKGTAYACNSTNPGSCGRMSRNGGPTEELVVTSFMRRADTPQLAAALSPDEGPVDAREELEDVQNRLALLADMWGRGELAEAEWRAARAPLMERKDALEDAMAETPRRSVDVGVLARSWDSLSVEQRRLALAVLIEKVVIHPTVSGRTFRPEHVEIVWKP